VIQYYKKELATYLAEMRGPGQSPMQIKLHARPKGEAARAIVTEYSIPVVDADPATTTTVSRPTTEPTGRSGHLRAESIEGLHDSQTDMNGNIWFTTSEPNYTRTVSMVDTNTGNVTNIKVPGLNGLAVLTHGLSMDQKGILWATVIGDPRSMGGSLMRIDPSTMKYDVIPPPKGNTGASTASTWTPREMFGPRRRPGRSATIRIRMNLRNSSLPR